MATIALAFAGQALGAAIGGSFSIFGSTLTTAVIGRSVGAFVGNYIDNLLFAPKQKPIEGPRYTETNFTSSTEGFPISLGFGYFRAAGNIIWASKFTETPTTVKVGGKGSPSSTTETTYAYTANFAIGICEGEISDILRIWADGKEIDKSTITYRIYTGSETQTADSLITSIETDAPAYRGTAYIVFEDFSVNEYGNRIPQFEFEVVKPVKNSGNNILRGAVKGVGLLPGSGEFIVDPEVVNIQTVDSSGSTVQETYANKSTYLGGSDWEEGINQLEDTLPNCGTLLLVSTWFADDLRCGSCSIKPGVEDTTKVTSPHTWKVDVYLRGSGTPKTLSQIDGSPAFGGTFSDQSLLRAINDLQSRGFKIIMYPFLQCDIPSGNTLPNPYSNNAASVGQEVYPWRGRITVSPTIGYTGSVDKTATAKTQIDTFYGDALSSEFTSTGSLASDTLQIQFTGAAQWSYSRFIMHHAYLCSLADQDIEYFCLGSEMVNLTRVRDNLGNFPFVDNLVTLAAQVNNLLPNTDISYSADWSEYHSYRPNDGSNDVLFNLDKLWSDSNIDFIAIDNYLPLSDWREGTNHLDYLAGWNSIYDLDYLKDNIEGGEYYDWYYENQTNRASQTRTTIQDGQHREDWIYRNKDIRNWWLNPHYDRPGGVRESLVNLGPNPTTYTSIAGATITSSAESSLYNFGSPADVATNGTFGSRARTSTTAVDNTGGKRFIARTFIKDGDAGEAIFVATYSGANAYLRFDFSTETITEVAAGHTINDSSFIDLGGGIYELILDVTMLSVDTTIFFGVGPISTTSGEYITVFGTEVHEYNTSLTGWVPQSKPILFTEFGCPAVDKGTNQPSAFFDAKSSSSAYPYFSQQTRDDLIQRQYLRAYYEYWASNNLTSTVYAGDMINIDESCVWAYDSRPWPSFPLYSSVWGDSENFYNGHWISGRLNSVYIPEILEELGTYFNIPYTQDYEDSFGNCYGVYSQDQNSFRSFVEPLSQIYSFRIIESGDSIKAVSMRSGGVAETLTEDDILMIGEEDITVTRLQETDLPKGITLSFGDITKDYNRATVSQERQITNSDIKINTDSNLTLDSGLAQKLVDEKLYDTWARRTQAKFSVLPEFRKLEPGDIVTINSDGFYKDVRIVSISDAFSMEITAESFDLNVFNGSTSLENRQGFNKSTSTISVPLTTIMDLPILDDNPDNWQPVVASYASPFVNVNVFRSNSTSNYQINTVVGLSANIGITTATFGGARPFVWDRGNELTVDLFGGSVATITEDEAREGLNALALETSPDTWEIIYFQTVTYNGGNSYTFTNLIRGMKGTDQNIENSLASGARVVILNNALEKLDFNLNDVKIPYYYRYGPATRDIGDETYTTVQKTFIGRGLKPYPVTDVKWSLDSGGNYEITWKRRTRVGGDYWDEGEVPLFETFEQYEIEILDGSDNVVRTFTAIPNVSGFTGSIPTIEYTSAQQAVDLITAPFSIRIYQISDLVGRGISKRATIG